MKSLKKRYNWNTNIWLGLTDEADEGDWANVYTGQMHNYFNWASRQPDNARKAEHHAELYTNSGASMGRWNDIPESAEREAVCIDDRSNVREVEFIFQGKKYRLHLRLGEQYEFGRARGYCNAIGMSMILPESAGMNTKIYQVMNTNEWNVSPFLAARQQARGKSTWINANNQEPLKFTKWGDDQPNIKEDVVSYAVMPNGEDGWWYSNTKPRRPVCILELGDAGPAPTTKPVTTTRAPGGQDSELVVGDKKLKIHYNPTKKGKFAFIKDYCESLGMTLPSPESKEENDAILKLKGNSKWGTTPYLGISDQAKEGTWINLSTEKQQTYFNWARGEPNNSGGEHHVELYHDGQWNDINGEKSDREAVCLEDMSARCDVDFKIGNEDYILHLQKKTLYDYNGVLKYCKGLGMEIIGMKNKQEHDAIVATMKKEGWGNIPFLAMRSNAGKVWNNPFTTTPQTYFNWNKEAGEPKEVKDSVKWYAFLDKDRKWSTTDDKNKRRPICYVKKANRGLEIETISEAITTSAPPVITSTTEIPYTTEVSRKRRAATSSLNHRLMSIPALSSFYSFDFDFKMIKNEVLSWQPILQLGPHLIQTGQPVACQSKSISISVKTVGESFVFLICSCNANQTPTCYNSQIGTKEWNVFQGAVHLNKNQWYTLSMGQTRFENFVKLNGINLIQAEVQTYGTAGTNVDINVADYQNRIVDIREFDFNSSC